MRVCNRNGCTNNDCKTFIPSIGDICDDCIRDFIDTGYFKEGEVLDDKMIISILDIFMAVNKPKKYDDLTRFFNRHKSV